MKRPTPAIALGVFLVACAGSPVPASRTTGAASQPIGPLPPPQLPHGEAWTIMAPRDLPIPLGDLAAIDDEHAIVIARDALYRVDGERFVPVCDTFDPPPTAVRADGDAFLAVGGGGAFRRSAIAPAAPGVAWYSRDRGVHCARVLLPVLTVASESQGRFDAALDQNVALVWNENGAIAMSANGGASWRRLPDLQGVSVVARASGTQLIAAAAIPESDIRGAIAAYSIATLHVLDEPHALAWRPLAIGPERRTPIALRRQPDGDVMVLDPLGTARIAPDGTLRGSAPIPAFHAVEDRPGLMVPAGPGRFVLTTEYTVDVFDSSGLQSVFARRERFPSAIDASASGAIWLADPRTLARGRLGNAHLEYLTHPPPLAGDASLVAVAGAHIALVGSLHSLARSDDAGVHWTELGSPDHFRDALAMAVGARGEVLLAFRTPSGRTAIAVHDGEAWLPLDPPFPLGEQPPRLHVAGDRWFVVTTSIFTSDDQGSTWRARPLEPGNPAVRALANHEGSMLALDQQGRLYRSTDGGNTYSVLQENQAFEHQLALDRGNATTLAWDGAHRVALGLGATLYRSNDDGVTLAPATGIGGVVNALEFAPGGEIVAVIDPPGSDRCGADGRLVVAAEAHASRTVAPVRDACAHAASAVALDGATMIFASRSGRIERLDLGQIGSITPGL